MRASKLEAWAKSVLNELLRLKELDTRVEELEKSVEYLESFQSEATDRLNYLDGRDY